MRPRYAFVGGQQRDPGLLQVILDLRAEVGDSGEPVHGLADHRDESTVRVAGLLQQVGDASVAWDGTLNISWASLCPRRSRLVRPDSTSQKKATMTQYGGTASRQRASCRGIDSVGSWLPLSDTQGPVIANLCPGLRCA